MKKTNTIVTLLIAIIMVMSCREEECLTMVPSDAESSLSTSSIRGSSIDNLYCQNGTYLGPAAVFNRTKIWSYVVIQDSRPAEVGYRIANQAFANLPNASAPEYTEVLLHLPNVPCQPFIFDHLTFHWNPHGHDPMGVYSIPHFDFHFYTIPLAERMAIGMADTAALVAPESCYIPEGFYGPIGPMSAMGSHWVDTTAPEFNGGPFTSAFIYGSYDGNVIFHEPMVSLDHLSSAVVNDVLPIRQPELYQRDGYYPTIYRVTKNSSYTTVSLTDFVFHVATACAPSM